jgi:pimeloyl-ACP methyl ester carboxylesterase
VSAAVQTKVKKTYVIRRDYGQFVVDYWPAENPSGKAPVLLVHGWGGTGSYWDETAAALSKTVDVYVPDLPGTGRSQPIKTTHNLYDQVDVLHDLLHTLELNRVQLVGHSMGGAMSVLLSARNPDRIERLVLTSLTFFMTQAQKDLYYRVMNGLRVSMLFRASWLVHVPGMPRLLGNHYFYEMPDNQDVLLRGLKDYIELDRHTAMACAENATDDAIKEAGAKVQAPTLLIACRQDQMMPLENVDFTLDILPDSDVRWIDECGHLPMVEKPDEYMSHLNEFLDL